MGSVIGFLEYDGKDSRDFGVYVGSTGIHVTPERDYEEIEIPGRNGTLTIDHGRFRNVIINYPAFILNDYADNFDAFKAFLCSHVGYHRLEDSFSPDYYRLARVGGVIEPTAGTLDEYGKFVLPFNCNPKRFYKSGEQSYDWTITRDDYLKYLTLLNPSYYDAKPLIRIEGSTTYTGTLACMTSFYNEEISGTSEIGHFTFTIPAQGSIDYTIDVENGLMYKTATGEIVQNSADFYKLVLKRKTIINTQVISVLANNYTIKTTVIPRWWTV